MKTSLHKSIEKFRLYKDRLQYEKESNEIFALLTQNAHKNLTN